MALGVSTEAAAIAELFILGLRAEAGVTAGPGSLNSLRGTTKGEDTSKEVEETLVQYSLTWNQLGCYYSWW